MSNCELCAFLPFREAAVCDKKPTSHTLVEAESALLKAEPLHLVSEVNKDELQKRVRNTAALVSLVRCQPHTISLMYSTLNFHRHQ